MRLLRLPWIRVVLGLVAVLAAAAVIRVFREEADADHAASDLILRMHQIVSEVATEESDAQVHRSLTPEGRRRIEQGLASLRRFTRALAAHDSVAGRLDAGVERYAVAASGLLALMERGRWARASGFDAGRLHPAADALDAQLDALGEEVLTEARQAEELADVATFSTVVGLSLALALISLSAVRRERRLAGARAAELERLATHDVLTGLPNRALLQDRLSAALARSRRDGSPFSLLLLDLDGFKQVNDLLGHQAGDDLLRQIGERLKRLVRGTDTVARLGGDEFAIILANTAGLADCARFVERLLAAVREPWTVAGSGVRVTASVGIASSADGSTPDELLRNADLSMYRAKQTGGEAAVHFEPEMQAALVGRLALERELRTAVDTGELLLHYQPVVRAEDGSLLAVEALVRWQHVERGLLRPAAFIPAAEQAGVLGAIGRWVLDHACRQLSEWRGAGAVGEDVAVAVNVSPAELVAVSFVGDVLATLERHGLPPDRLILEVTESMFADERGGASQALAALRAAGVLVAMDDFGTGFSSLSRLGSLPIDRLKVDRSFISQIQTTSIGNPLTATILAMGHALRLHVVAEGVETEEQLAALRRLSCDSLQGFLVSRPVPAPELAALAQTSFGLAPAPPMQAGSEDEAKLAELASRVVSSRETLDDLAPAVLEELQAILGFQSVYLCRLDPHTGEQRVLYAVNAGGLEVRQGASIEWSDRIWRRTVADRRRFVPDLPAAYPESAAAAKVGIQSFMSFTVNDVQGRVVGALCAASRRPVSITDAVVTMVELFARALGEWLVADGQPRADSRA